VEEIELAGCKPLILASFGLGRAGQWLAWPFLRTFHQL
jgi:hypothetical protein